MVPLAGRGEPYPYGPSHLINDNVSNLFFKHSEIHMSSVRRGDPRGRPQIESQTELLWCLWRVGVNPTPTDLLI